MRAIGAVWVRELLLFRRYWRPTSFAAVAEPAVFLLALGLGLGALITTVDGIPYVQFVGTGSVATAALFASVFPGMFNTFVRRFYQKTYDGMLATPITVGEIVIGEATWTAVKSGLYATAPIIITVVFFGLPPAWGMLAIPFIAILTGLGFVLLGQWLSGVVSSIDSFNYVTSALITPLFLVAGTFFPLTNLPPWALVAAQLNPLYHCVQLVRNACFGWAGWADLWHVGFLVAFAAVMAALAIPRLRKRLID